MAKRIIFEAVDKKPYVKVHEAEFVWNKGLNIKQKRKNISAIMLFLKSIPTKKYWKFRVNLCRNAAMS